MYIGRPILLDADPNQNRTFQTGRRAFETAGSAYGAVALIGPLWHCRHSQLRTCDKSAWSSWPLQANWEIRVSAPPEVSSHFRAPESTVSFSPPRVQGPDFD